MTEYRHQLYHRGYTYTCVAQEIGYLWPHTAQITSLISLTPENISVQTRSTSSCYVLYAVRLALSTS